MVFICNNSVCDKFKCGIVNYEPVDLYSKVLMIFQITFKTNLNSVTNYIFHSITKFQTPDVCCQVCTYMFRSRNV